MIDCFTKFALGIPVKSKKPTEIANAMAKILINCSPILLQLDNGKELYNKIFDALMTKYNMKNYSTYNISYHIITIKACIVDRFNRTLKANMFREFIVPGSQVWITILLMLMNK